MISKPVINLEKSSESRPMHFPIMSSPWPASLAPSPAWVSLRDVTRGLSCTLITMFAERCARCLLGEGRGGGKRLMNERGPRW